MKKRLTYNSRLVKAKHSYSLQEVADLFKKHIRTPQSWVKQGLKVIDPSSRPFLIWGADLQVFLNDRSKKRKKPLKDDEFFCSKCRCQRRSIPEKIRYELTSRKLGKFSRQAYIRGVCETCGQAIMRFSSENKVMRLQGRETITDSDNGSVNTDIRV